MQAVSSADSFADTTFFRYVSIRLIVFLGLLRYNLERWFSKDDLQVPAECSGEDVSRRELSASAGCRKQANGSLGCKLDDARDGD
jgi:hypothetical protein